MGAKELKAAILQEAISGRLVPQIASEGNARDLLEEIRKEKLSHRLDFANAKSGKKKSKKETALAGSNPCDITEDEIPFDIPENWCWCRLGEICNEIKRGKSPKYADKSNLRKGVNSYDKYYFTQSEDCSHFRLVTLLKYVYEALSIISEELFFSVMAGQCELFKGDRNGYIYRIKEKRRRRCR